MSGKTHLARLHQLPCVVCRHMGMHQDSPTVAHHLESIRDGSSDFAAIAICQDHHQGSGNGIHDLSRRGFEMRYRLTEIDLLALTVKALEQEGMLV